MIYWNGGFVLIIPFWNNIRWKLLVVAQLFSISEKSFALIVYRNVGFPRTQVHILNSQTRILFYSTLIFKSESNHITLDRVCKSSEKGLLSMSDTKFTEVGGNPNQLSDRFYNWIRWNGHHQCCHLSISYQDCWTSILSQLLVVFFVVEIFLDVRLEYGFRNTGLLVP